MLKRVLCVLTSIALVLAMMPSVVATSSSSTSTGSSTTTSWVAYTNNGTTEEGYYSYTFSWSEVSDASYYIVTINGESYDTTSTYYTVSTLENGKTYIVYVTAYDSDDSSTGTVGVATFTVGTSSSSSSSSSSSTSTSTTGTNCTVTSYASYKTVTWNAYDGAEYYVVTYFVDTSSTGTSLTTASTSISLPIANTSDVTIYVTAYDSQGIALGMIATANVAASSSSSSSTTGISCSFVGINSDMSYNYVFSWNMYSSETTGYHIYINGAYADSTTSMSYSATFPSGSYYTVGVYAFDSSGSILGTVGQVSFSTASISGSSTTEDNCVLVGITSDGLDRYLISWDEYDGAIYYQVVAYVPKSEGSSTYTKYATSDYTENLEITVDIEDGQDYLFYVYAYDPSYYRLGVASHYKMTANSPITTEEVTYTISIPSSALFSSAEAGDYMKITLPTNVSNPVSESDISPSVTDLSVSYTLTMANVSIKLQPSDGYESTYDTYTQTVEMGAFARDYTVVDDVTFSPMFPASVLSSNTDIITITATVDISGYSNDPTMSVEELYTVYGSPITVKYYDSEGTQTGSIWYMSSLSTSKSTSLHSITSSSIENGTLTTDLVSAASGLTVTVEATAESGYELSGVTVTNADGASVAVTDCGDGTYTFTMPSSAVTVSADVSHAHSLTKTDAVDETCLTDGNIEYWYCSVCGKYYSDEDCTTEIALEDTIIEAIGHNYESVVTEPTCTEGGYTTYTCSNCGDSYVADETEATGHSYEAVVTEPTCTEGGYTTHTCSTCGDTYTDNEIEALGHNYESEVTTEATCTAAGVKTYTCTRCGDTYTEEIEATGHTTEIKNAKDATCTEDGYTGDEVCTVCGEVVTAGEAIEATGHTTEIQNAVDAACTEDGYTGDEVCTVCGETITVGTVIPATGHSFNSEGVCETCGAKTGESGTTSTVTVESDDTIFANVLPSGLVTSVEITVSNTDGGTLVVSTVVEVSAYPYLVEHIADTLSFTLYNEAQGDDLISDTDSFTITTTENNKKTLKKVTILFYGDIDYSGTGTSTVTMNFTATSDLSSSEIYVLHYTGSYPTWEVVTSTVTFSDTTVTVEFEASDYSPFVVLSVASASSGGSSSALDILLRISANYSAVTEAIDRANALNPSDYENFSEVTEAINAVNWNLKAINQLTVNAYADAINTAIDNLVKTTSNITEETVNIAEPIENINTDTEEDVF